MNLNIYGIVFLICFALVFNQTSWAQTATEKDQESFIAYLEKVENPPQMELFPKHCLLDLNGDGAKEVGSYTELSCNHRLGLPELQRSLIFGTKVQSEYHPKNLLKAFSKISDTLALKEVYLVNCQDLSAKRTKCWFKKKYLKEK
jgi:hypothetical protein